MTKQPPLFPLPKAPAPADFEAFWQVYPRKVDRHDAEKAWRRATKAATAADLVAAAERFGAAMEGKEREFIAHAATWLNKRRWLDYAAPATIGAEVLEPAKEPEAQRPQGSGAEVLRAALDAIAAGGLWDRPTLGPAPGERGCRVPAHAIRQADVDRLRQNEAEARDGARLRIIEQKGKRHDD